MNRPSTVAILGADARTGNLGVSALFCATSAAIAARTGARQFLLGDHDSSDPGRPAFLDQLGVEEVAARWSRRVWSNRSIANVKIRGALGLSGGPTTAAGVLARAAAAMDVSGGDSFTDLYGDWRFNWIARTKEAALAMKAPLILLPQTYGPFAGAQNRDRAGAIVRSAAVAWARDERSFEVLRDLLGDAFDPAIHRAGVDVAFLLPVVPPGDAVQAQLGPLRTPPAERAAPVIGLNISGLIWNDPERARSRFNFRADYNAALTRFVVRVLDESDALLAFIPHVVTPPGQYESDLDASAALREAVVRERPGAAERITVAPAVDDPRHAKWIISRCDWFCGTRMHSTIAGLSSGVPTAAISYSPKTLGVFETCSMGDHVHDPVAGDTESIVDGMLASFVARRAAGETLRAALPGVMQTANAQFDHIADAIRAGSEPLAAAR